MNQYQQRASAFIHRLLANPALKHYTPLQKEEQVFQFIAGNMQQLGPTLRSSAFFPDLDMNQIQTLLYSTLVQLTNERLLPSLKTIVQKVDFSFIQFLRQQQTRPSAIQEQVLKYLTSQLKNYEFRRGFTGAYTALHYDFPNRYINEAYRLHRHIFFELTKVQRLKMSKEEVKSFVELSMLLKPMALAMTNGSDDSGMDGRNGLIAPPHARKLAQKPPSELNLLPPQAITSAINANVSFIEDAQVETTARLAGVLSARARNYLPGITVDRGADTPDKSWLNIARRNYKFYGFDIKMLDEMYMIAAENGW